MTPSHLYEKRYLMPRVTDEYLENKRKEIIDAAYRVCLKKPITSMEMKDVIDELGFSHGVIYRYYNDLDEVLHDLVLRMNSENDMEERLKQILNSGEPWEKVIHEMCGMLAENMLSEGIERLKISAYADMLAMSEPDRVLRIASKLNSKIPSPLTSLEALLSAYLSKTIKAEKLRPIRSKDEIMQFIIVSYHGIQTGYILSECSPLPGIDQRYQPKLMFSCLAESVIHMLKGKRK